jgi:hypothetical protein
LKAAIDFAQADVLQVSRETKKWTIKGLQNIVGSKSGTNYIAEKFTKHRILVR